MSSVRDELVRDYAKHYTRMQAGKIDPKGLLAGRRAKYELDFGDLVRRVPQGGKVLDLGCGMGNLLAWLSEFPNIQPCGVDGSASQVEIARQHLPNSDIQCGDGLQYLKEHVGQFSGIICTDVLEHIPGKDLLADWVRSARAALAPGGFFFCRSPNAASLLGSFCRYRDLTHECSFTVSSFLQLLEVAGFDDCAIRPIRSAKLSGKLRLWIERQLHQIIFRICGEAGREEYTTNICAVGFVNGRA